MTSTLNYVPLVYSRTINVLIVQVITDIQSKARKSGYTIVLSYSWFDAGGSRLGVA